MRTAEARMPEPAWSARAGGIALSGVRKLFGDRAVVDGVDLEIAAGGFTAIVGPSGAGKSTLLRLIAGLEDPTEGEIRIDGRAMDEVAAKDRDIAMVFQHYALYPHLTVFRNLAVPLELRRMARTEVERRVEAAAAALDISYLLNRKPGPLSGGQRQRVALARALVREPRLFLLDEPLSNLDAQQRAALRAEIAALHRRLGVTFVYVTHDQAEAMAMADTIVVMNEGRIEQVACPQALYARPANLFVASFIGMPPMNLVPVRRGGAMALSLPRAAHGTGELVLGLRPERLSTVPDGTGVPITGVVELIEPMGATTKLTVRADGQRLVASLATRCAAQPGDRLTLWADLRGAVLFDAASGLALPEAAQP